jgi:hypothetical protein
MVATLDQEEGSPHGGAILLMSSMSSLEAPQLRLDAVELGDMKVREFN